MIKKLGTLVIVLQIIFIILRLVGAIHWSWVWVLSPIWLSVGIGVASVVWDNLFN